jgi:hypothetical protein
MRFTAFVLLSVLVEFAHGFGVSSEPSTEPIKGDPWINELHYDNKGADEDEQIEVCAPVTTNIKLYELALYNGANGKVYGTTKVLDEPNTENVYQIIGCASFGIRPIQNGHPDGVALVESDTQKVVEFLSYEGSFTATDGPAAGTLSKDIGVSEKGQYDPGRSLQLQGTGTQASNFWWDGPLNASFGEINTKQRFEEI